MVVDMVTMKNQKGFTYLIALFLVATLSIITLRALENSLTKDRRAKEEQLLFVGQAYQKAIMIYFQNGGTYPTSLEALLDTPGTSTRQQTLRRLYFDPMTGSQDWELVTVDGGGIKGINSKSTQQPIKVGGFPAALSSFNNTTSYQQWQFVYPPNPANPTNSTNQTN
jgi:type II secretory pathway pseudopilin PulG